MKRITATISLACSLVLGIFPAQVISQGVDNYYPSLTLEEHQNAAKIEELINRASNLQNEVAYVFEEVGYGELLGLLKMEPGKHHKKIQHLITNSKNAIALYQEAYQLGSFEAARLAGMVYNTILRDREKAKEWFHKAIEAGDSEGFFLLAVMPENHSKIDFYLDQGIENGSQMAAYFVASTHYANHDIEEFDRVYSRIIEVCDRLMGGCTSHLLEELNLMNSELNKE